MKIKLPFSKKYIYLRKVFSYPQTLISLGCDCHPAHTIQYFGLRKFSLPFDWLNTNPINGIEYINSNLKDNFRYFLDNMYFNKNGYLVSSKYDYAEFMHAGDLTKNQKTRQSFMRRVNRFTKLVRENDCHFLYTITSESLDNLDKVNYFVNSVKVFSQVLKNNDKLSIYIRYEKNYDENKDFCDDLIIKINTIDKINATRYIRNEEKYGGWGNEEDYHILYQNVGIILGKVHYKLYIK